MNARAQPVAIAEAKTGPFATHEVRNQARPSLGFNAFDGDRALSGLVAKIAPWAKDKLSALGAHAGCESVQEAARLANEHEPKLLTHDRYGNRNDWVEFHPAWHQLMALAFQSEVHSLAWSTREPNGHFARAALSYLWNQIENGVGCPTGMAYAAIAGFAGKPQFATWRERTLAADYDPRRLPIEAKRAAVIGYAMTEKQGGSDLRETQTTARFIERGAHGEIYAITGHKWFFSVPVADGFYTLAQTESGVSCLFVPRLLPDGSANRIFIQRLKDKCGNRSNASSEIEYHDTWSILVGEEGRGIREILSHAHLTRLDFAAGSAGLMRQALSLALNHAQTRTAFGKPMSELPMQRNVLADLALESEAAMLGALRDRACHRRPGDQRTRTAAGAGRDASGEVLELPARAGFQLRVPAGARRQRLHHGECDGAPLPRGAAEFDLGGHLEHDVHGRAARHAARCALPGRLHRRVAERAGASAGSTTAARKISPIDCVHNTRMTGMRGRWSPGWHMRCRLPRCCSMAMPMPPICS